MYPAAPNPVHRLPQLMADLIADICDTAPGVNSDAILLCDVPEDNVPYAFVGRVADLMGSGAAGHAAPDSAATEFDAAAGSAGGGADGIAGDDGTAGSAVAEYGAEPEAAFSAGSQAGLVDAAADLDVLLPPDHAGSSLDVPLSATPARCTRKSPARSSGSSRADSGAPSALADDVPLEPPAGKAKRGGIASTGSAANTTGGGFDWEAATKAAAAAATSSGSDTWPVAGGYDVWEQPDALLALERAALSPSTAARSAAVLDAVEPSARRVKPAADATASNAEAGGHGDGGEDEVVSSTSSRAARAGNSAALALARGRAPLPVFDFAPEAIGGAWQPLDAPPASLQPFAAKTLPASKATKDCRTVGAGLAAAGFENLLQLLLYAPREMAECSTAVTGAQEQLVAVVASVIDRPRVIAARGGNLRIFKASFAVPVHDADAAGAGGDSASPAGNGGGSAGAAAGGSKLPLGRIDIDMFGTPRSMWLFESLRREVSSSGFALLRGTIKRRPASKPDQYPYEFACAAAKIRPLTSEHTKQTDRQLAAIYAARKPFEPDDFLPGPPGKPVDIFCICSGLV